MFDIYGSIVFAILQLSDMQSFISKLESRLEDELPGHAAQLLMAPRSPKRYFQASTQHNKAAVLILLYPLNNRLFFALIKRRSNAKQDKHAGQVSLPGGRLEKEDNSLLHCALRETQEELGIIQNDVTPIGSLSKLYVFASNHMVYPFVGFTPRRPKFILDKREVDWLIEADVSYLLSPGAKKETDILTHGIQLKNVPYFPIDGEIVWGATAMILSEFIEVWKTTPKD